MKNLFEIVLVLICVSFCSNAAFAYDVQADWVDVPNSSTVWSFGTSLDIGVDFTQFADHVAYSHGDMWHDLPAFEPWVAKADPSWGWVTEPDKVYMHPGPAVDNGGPGLAAVSRLTVDTAGNYDINGMFNGRDSGIKDVYILVNDTLVFSQLSLTGLDNAPFFLTGISLGIGDTVDFVVDAVGTYASTCTGLEATVIPGEDVSPEPNLVLHLKADADVLNQSGTSATNGQTVGKWLDQSDYDFVAKLNWGAPTLDTTGAFPVITFDGDDGLDIDSGDAVDPFDPNALKLTNFMVFVVGKINSADQQSKIFFADDAGAGFNVGISDNYSDMVKFYTSDGDELNSNLLVPLETEKYYLINGYRSGIEKKLYLNTNLEGDGYGSSSYNDDVIATIGALAGGSQFLDGSIAEIQVWSDPNEYTRKQVEDALVAAYNIDTTPRELDSETVILTHMTYFRCDASGTEMATERWGSFYPSAMWPIAVYDSEIPADPCDLINNISNMQLFEPITTGDGQRTFSGHVGSLSNEPGYMGINLFFNHSELQNEPWISAYVNMDPNLPGESPDYEFMPNSAAATTGWQIVPTPGSGTTRYVYPKPDDPNIKLAVALDAYAAYHEDAYNLDRVHYQGPLPEDANEFHIINDGPDGVDDKVFEFKLRLITATCEDIGSYYWQDNNKDCRINLDDFLSFIENWLWCNDPLDPTCTYPLP